MNGLSFNCGDWRFNLRKSNTEPLVRLNLEALGNSGGLEERISELSAVIVG
jgi:phosphomannomutase